MRLFIVLAAVAGSVAAASMQNTANRFEIVFGGYAAVVTGGNTLDIATIKKPGIFSTDYEPHPLHLSIAIGTVELSKTTVLPETLGHGSEFGWDLTGLTVEVVSDGNPLPKDPITLPPYSNVSTCETNIPDDQINNRFFIPDLSRIANQQALKEDLESRLDGRLRVHGGTLAVTALVPGCFEFKKDGKPVGTPQRIANGRKGLTYTHPMGEMLVLRLSKKGKLVGDVAIVPRGNRVRLAIYPRHLGESMANRPIKHFKYFYSLLRNSVDDDERLIPTWLGARDSSVSPGEACPPGLYEIP